MQPSLYLLRRIPDLPQYYILMLLFLILFSTLKIIHRFSQQESTPYQANKIYSHYNGRFVFTPSYFPFYQPQSDVHPPNLAVPGIEGRPNSTQTVASSKRPRQRRDWTDTEPLFCEKSTKLLIPWESLLVKQRKPIQADGKTLRRVSIRN